MLTVDYGRLGLEPGDLVLDLGCGGGRHAFEAARRGAHIVAFDLDRGEVAEAGALLVAMRDSGEIDPAGFAAGVCGDATRIPFPDATFDRIIASEVMEHVPDDGAAISELVRVLKPGGVIAVTVPSWLPEQICWRLTDEYHAPKAVGGHVRIYTEGGLSSLMAGAGLDVVGSHRAHALHSPYWWLKCAVGVSNDDNPLVKAYLKLLTWDITSAPPVTRWTEKILNPVLGKSLVVYGRRSEAAAGTRRDKDDARAAA